MVSHMKLDLLIKMLIIASVAIINLSACTEKEGDEQEDVLETFFADVRIPKITVEDAVEDGRISFSCFANGLDIGYFTLDLRRVGERVEFSGDGFLTTGMSCVGSIEDNRIVIMDDWPENPDPVLVDATFKNLAYFTNSIRYPVIGKNYWIATEVYNKIEEETPAIYYKAEDGTDLKVKYFRNFWGSHEFKAFGFMYIRDMSREFFDHLNQSHMLSEFSMETLKQYAYSSCWTFVLNEDNEISINLDFEEDGNITLLGDWTADRLTFPALRATGGEDYTFTCLQ